MGYSKSGITWARWTSQCGCGTWLRKSCLSSGKKKWRDQLYKRNCSTNWMFKLIVKSGLNVPCLLAQDQCETFFSLETENVWMVVMVLSCRCAGSCCQPCHVWWLRLRACSFGCVQKIGTSNPMKSNIKLANWQNHCGYAHFFSLLWSKSDFALKARVHCCGFTLDRTSEVMFSWILCMFLQLWSKTISLIPAWICIKI